MAFTELNDIEAEFGEKPPEKNGNRTFMIIAGILGGVMIMALLCIAGLALFRNSPSQSADQGANATAKAQATALVLAATQTSFAALPSANQKPLVLPTDTKVPTNPPVTVIAAVKTSDVMATVHAMRTQKALSSPTAVPPTSEPTLQPTTEQANIEPTAQPTSVPATAEPTAQPTEGPVTAEPTAQPTLEPTTAEPTLPPTQEPSTAEPTLPPTQEPSTAEPSAQVTQESVSQTTTTSQPAPQATAEPTPSTLPQTGIADELGTPGLIASAFTLIAIIFVVRRLRTAS